jgi:hypothetical protein
MARSMPLIERLGDSPRQPAEGSEAQIRMRGDDRVRSATLSNSFQLPQTAETEWHVPL